VVSTPQGWYPDPHGSSELRWWDGTNWTGYTTAATSAAPGRRLRRWPWIAGAGTLVAFLLPAVALVVVPIVKSSTASIDGANVYLRTLRDGNTSEGFVRLCDELRAQASYDEYVRGLAAEQAQTGRLISFNASRSTSEIGHGKEAIVAVKVKRRRAYARSKLACDVRAVSGAGAAPVRNRTLAASSSTFRDGRAERQFRRVTPRRKTWPSISERRAVLPPLRG
jgi:hypothetical protein